MPNCLHCWLTYWLVHLPLGPDSWINTGSPGPGVLPTVEEEIVKREGGWWKGLNSRSLVSFSVFLFHFILSAPCLNDFRFAASRFTEARRAAIIPASIHFDYHNSCRYPVQTCHVGRSQGHAPSREVSGKFNNLNCPKWCHRLSSTKDVVLVARAHLLQTLAKWQTVPVGRINKVEVSWVFFFLDVWMMLRCVGYSLFFFPF